ncbi:MAG: hypothetical protein NZO58_01890 [Gemmataceae bacterium]|nr:hypothetical protein [Gemmataceae bacterium]
MNRTTHRLVLLTALGITAALPAASSAHGLRRSCGSCGSHESSCGVAEARPVEYRECTVVTYQPKWEKREIEVWESKMVQKDSTEKVLVTKTKTEPRKFIECRPVVREEKYEYYVMVPEKKTKVVNQVYCERQVTEYHEQVPVCRTVRVPCYDSCGRCCGYRCETVHDVCTVRRCKVELVRKERPVEVTYYEYKKEKREGVRKVSDVERHEVVRDVTVSYNEWVERPCKVWVCEKQKVKRVVDVCTMERVETVVRVPVVCDTGTTGCGGGRRIFGGCCGR